ncbi:hypothetical protein tinsulaeT_15750 [Thalassotalea insulae]|uniref:WD40 repeat domain-containing protein n=1 Tax=Thalassotalea insulae TaxID=2056778 RepID=A0ABQ6GUQ0_9GAMM|nr:hypothetical protein [Thalassotalea insulae]GLX78235.1 hypothetical protein tinsulaeT_15750 [Thalassotalea insulae]
MNKIIKKFSIFSLLLLITACSENDIYTSPATLEQHYSDKVLKAAAISDDGSYSLLSTGKQVCLWQNKNNAKVFPCLKGLEAQMIELVGISTSNQYFYTSNRINVHLYDLVTGRLITVWSAGDNIINDIAMSANERKLIFGFRSGQASVVAVKSNEITTFKPHRLDINSVSISDDGDKAFTGSSDKTAMLWDTQTGKVIHSFDHHSRVNHVTMSGDGKVGFSLDAVKDRSFWLLKIGKPFAELNSHIKFIEFNDSQFSSNNLWLASASPKQKLRLWQVKTGKLSAQWLTFKNKNRNRASVITLKFINNTTLATITSDGVYQTWDLPPEIS